MSALRLKRSVKSRMQALPRGVGGRGPKKSSLMAMPGPEGRGMVMMGQRTVSRDVLRAWHLWQLRVQSQNPRGTGGDGESACLNRFALVKILSLMFGTLFLVRY